MGRARVHQGDLLAVLGDFLAALRVVRDTGHRFNEGVAHLNLARTYRGLGRWREAKTHYEEAARSFSRSEGHEELLGQVQIEAEELEGPVGPD